MRISPLVSALSAASTHTARSAASVATATPCADQFCRSSSTVSTAPHTPGSLRAISSPAEKLTESKAYFSTLAAPTAIPTGTFQGDFVGLFAGGALAKLAVPALWDGVRFGGNDATILVNPWLAWMLPKEVGTASIADSTYDDGKTLRVDFEDRFWESRKVSENQYFSIVTNKESGEVMDLHTLTNLG